MGKRLTPFQKKYREAKRAKKRETYKQRTQAAKAAELAKLRKQAEVADLYLTGMTLRQIGERVDESAATVFNWLKAFKQELKERMLGSTADKINELIASQRRTKREAEEAWQLSKLPEVEETIEAISDLQDVDNPDGTKSKQPVTVKRIAVKKSTSRGDTKRQVGDASLLRIINDCDREIARLMQLTDKPTRVNVRSSSKVNNVAISVSSPSHDELVAQIEAMNLSDEELKFLPAIAEKFARIGSSNSPNAEGRDGSVILDAVGSIQKPGAAISGQDGPGET